MLGGVPRLPAAEPVEGAGGPARRHRRPFVVGDPTRHETFLGAVIDEGALRRLESTIGAAKELTGHRILTGGTVRPETGWFVDPTIFVTEDPTSFLMEKEFFGPLLTVHVYDDAADLGQGPAPGRLDQRVRPHLLDLRQRPGRDRDRARPPARHRRHDLRQRQAHRRADRPAGLRRRSRLGHQRQGRLAAGPAALGQRPLREGELRARRTTGPTRTWAGRERASSSPFNGRRSARDPRSTSSSAPVWPAPPPHGASPAAGTR